VEKKHEVRQEKSVDIVDGIFAQMEEWKEEVLPQSALGKAIQYALNRRDALEVYLEDGRVPIDNNATERTIRAIALGRKNWLFTGSVEGGKRAAGMYSLVQTCKLQGVEPWEYLKDVFARAPFLDEEGLARLTPRLWKEARD
jgi:transposase